MNNNKILYIPLDDRPVNLEVVIQLANLAELEIKVPKKENLGSFFNEGNVELIKEWIKSEKCDALIVSLDMLIYGGLIASRTDKKSLEESRKILNFLKDYKKENKEIKIYAFSNIMRLSISVSNDESQIWWGKINEYNELRYRVESLNEVSLKNKLNQIESEIPQDVLNTYLRTRERNHKVNMESIELVKEGIIDFLILSQEDCSKYGLHLIEHKRIHEKINKYKLEDRIYVYPGADEIGQILVSRYVNDIRGFRPKVYVDFDDKEAEDSIPKFEDRSLKININEHLKSTNALIMDKYDECDYILAVTTPNIPYIDMASDTIENYNKKIVIDNFISRIKNYINLGKKVSIADLAFSNGGDEYLIKRLKEENLLLKVIAYGAWNTAGNAMGTSIAHGNIISNINSNNNLNFKKSLESLKFLIERYCDDYIYQSSIRNETTKEVLKEGLSIFNMNKRVEKIDSFVEKSLNRMTNDYFYKSKVSYLEAKGEIEEVIVKAKLPWNRTFEVECEVNIKFKEGRYED
ncbi:DUF4127 family protein [Clostridium tertium]|uniref:DUF4127 family protein n=1 Tax=Clostridium tertium TaxID=1559 RepID=UPI0011597762|nr:DUF4127 family protein [Clostridium tertium]MDB1956159.1 DUF4127 family protein [Clostridium tertium]MDB1959440.1 DUF4127 family protein [Clostridium tertium]MDB1962027.1 DUF4127 family protein [Clostridium tertium]MDB1964930.1 DUF4127 family protein [Clostridium tertium]